MKKLYAPWRTEYARRFESAQKEKIEGCVFCQQIAAQEDEKYFILGRFKHHAVMLNKYPYNPGHLLIVPYDHIQNLHQQSEQARAELIALIDHATKIWQQQLQAPGVNIGINLGKAAGAGLPDHMHTHILPRWLGDTNFLPALADTKQISIDLHEVYQDLLPFFKQFSYTKK